MTETKQTDEQRARNALADAFGPKGTAAPDKIRAGSKYVTIPVNTAIRAMIAFAAPPVPATNQAGEVERLVEVAIKADPTREHRDYRLNPIYEEEREQYRPAVVAILAALATQPATSQEGEGLAGRLRNRTQENPMMAVRDRELMLEAAAALAATPTPPTLPGDDDELAMALCEADGHDPHEMTYHFTEPGVQEPYGDRWNHYTQQAARLRSCLAPGATGTPGPLVDLEDEIAEAIDDSLDMDWTSKVGARHVMALLRAKGLRAMGLVV